jgi:hypothetical protein
MGHRREGSEMKSSEETRHLVPVFVEMRDGQDIKDLVYFKDQQGGFKSLAQLESEYSAEFPGVLTTGIIETCPAEGDTTITTVLASPFTLCCRIIGGMKICFPC